jgi:hypothetical protein
MNAGNQGVRNDIRQNGITTWTNTKGADSHNHHQPAYPIDAITKGANQYLGTGTK